MEEKSLVNLKKANIFQEIKMFFYKLFHKGVSAEKPVIEDFKEDVNIVDEFKKEKDIMQLQRDFESGTIREEELSNVEKQELLSLYKQQIANLEENICVYNKTISIYKEKIMDIKNKLN